MCPEMQVESKCPLTQRISTRSDRTAYRGSKPPKHLEILLLLVLLLVDVVGSVLTQQPPTMAVTRQLTQAVGEVTTARPATIDDLLNGRAPAAGGSFPAVLEDAASAPEAEDAHVPSRSVDEGSEGSEVDERRSQALSDLLGEDELRPPPSAVSDEGAADGQVEPTLALAPVGAACGPKPAAQDLQAIVGVGPAAQPP